MFEVVCRARTFESITSLHSTSVEIFIKIQKGGKMKISREKAFELWEKVFGNKEYAEDFSGGLMYKHAYGNPNYYEYRNGQKIYCGWNIHHVLPIAHGGSNSLENLVCVNIITNETAGDKITYWIGDTLYQVKKIKGTHIYEIVEIR